MIYLEPGTFSAVTLTLYEKCVNRIDPYFTFKLIDKDSDDEVIFSVTDNSPIPYYWNSFTFSSVSLTGTQYTYQAYEMLTANDLDIDNAVGLVETGIVTINVTSSNIQSYTGSNTTTVYRNLDRM